MFTSREAMPSSPEKSAARASTCRCVPAANVEGTETVARYGESETVVIRVPSRRNATDATPVSSDAVAVTVIVVPAVAVPGASSPTVGGVVSGACTIKTDALLTARLSDVSMACAENVIEDPTGVPAGMA